MHPGNLGGIRLCRVPRGSGRRILQTLNSPGRRNKDDAE